MRSVDFEIPDREFSFFTEKDMDELGKRGYQPIKKLGEGRRRHAILSKFKSGEAVRYRVIKIPKEEPNPTVGYAINAKGKGSNGAEVKTSNELSHQNIIAVVDNFELSGKNVTVEEFTEGRDLESLVKSTGKITDEDKIRDIFKQIIAAEKHLLLERFLHRDIKPSNIFVSHNGLVQLGDLENSARIFELEDGVLPTRGGPSYTHPDLLQAPLTGIPTHASERTEIYAIAATLFYALTGREIFYYRLESAETGKEIELEGKKFRASLKEKGVTIEKITEKEHEKRLKQELKEVPRNFRKISYKGLTLNKKKAYRNIYGMDSDLKDTEKSLPRKIGEKILGILTPALITASVATGITYAILHRPEPREPTLSEILRGQDYSKFSLEAIAEQDRDYALGVLQPYIVDLEKKISRVKEEKVGQFRQLTKRPGEFPIYVEDTFINHAIYFAKNIHGMPKRLISAWLKACNLVEIDKLPKGYTEGENERLTPSYVPKHFVITNNDLSPSNPLNVDDMAKVAYGIMKLKTHMAEKDVAEVYARYFSNNDEVDRAKIEIGNSSYFPRFRKGKFEPGYGQALPARELVNTAVVLYLATDEEGNTDLIKFEKLKPSKYLIIPESLTQNQSYNNPSKGLVAK